jgi:hypothetical protein
MHDWSLLSLHINYMCVISSTIHFYFIKNLIYYAILHSLGYVISSHIFINFQKIFEKSLDVQLSHLSPSSLSLWILGQTSFHSTVYSIGFINYVFHSEVDCAFAFSPRMLILCLLKSESPFNQCISSCLEQSEKPWV